MRWSIKKLSAYNNKYKVIKKFAWLPTVCNDDVGVWLEYYWQEYRCRKYSDVESKDDPWWASIKKYDYRWFKTYKSSMCIFPDQNKKEYVKIQM